jgi:hypothetical protein
MMLDRDTLILPPAYTLVTLREMGDAHAHACQIARETGAGTLVWVRRFDLIEFAVILEPDSPLKEARRAFIAGMAALADAIATHCPPEKPLHFIFPDAIRFDGALLGGGRLGIPEGCGPDDVPEWLVFSAMLVGARAGIWEPGFAPDQTSLEDEGFDDVDASDIIESFARHLMNAFDSWHHKGFRPIADSYLERLPKERAADKCAIDTNGDLLTRAHHKEAPERTPIEPGFAGIHWFDPKTGEPRL